MTRQSVVTTKLSVALCLVAGFSAIVFGFAGKSEAAPEDAAPAATETTTEATTATPTGATPTGAASTAAAAGTSLQLNKLEAYDKGCRAYVVIQNDNEEPYESFKLDLVIFQTDGVIGKRFALDLAPLRANRKSVKIFEIADTACDKIGSFLINDVIECKTSSGPVDGCMSRLTTSTLSNVEISK